MMIQRVMVIGSILIGLGLPAQAANYYVRPPGQTYGSGNGSDWNNAYTSLPETLVRGATYFVADGTYGSYAFDDLESGTSVVTIKKATITDHGTNSGWADTFGEGTATWGTLTFARDYYVFDGQVRNESRWDEPNSDGFRASAVQSWPINFPPGGDHVTIQYCDIGGPYSESYGGKAETGVYLVKNDGTAGLLSQWTIRRCHIHNITVHLYLLNVENFLIEYNYFGPGWGKEAIRGASTTRDGIIRFNLFRDSSQETPGEPGSGSTAPIAIWGSNSASAYRNLLIHGNVFWDTKSIPHSGGTIVLGGDGTSWLGAPANNCVVHNNTIAGLRNFRSGILINGGAENRAYNNLWFNAGTATTGASGAGLSSGNNLVLTSHPFVDVNGGNMRLAAGAQAINQGSNQGSPYSIDLDGNARGADGVWDVGAFEFKGVSGLTPPSGFRLVLS